MYASSEFQIAAPAEGVRKQLNWLQADDRGDCGLKVMYKIDASNRYWPATRPTLTSRGHVGAGRPNIPQALLLAAALFCGVSVSWDAQAGSSYLAVWSSDKQNHDHRLNTDFLAIVDADPRSSTYGKVVNTATMEHLPGTNLLDESRNHRRNRPDSQIEDGRLILDTAFKDELTGRPCVSMGRPMTYNWPNHGQTGAAKPHAMAFIDGEDRSGK